MGSLQLREDGNPLSVEALAAETERGFDSKANLPRRLARFSKAKDRALLMRDFITADPLLHIQYRKQRLELGECGSYLVFRQYVELDKVRLHGMRSCRQHLLCPLCAIRRGSKFLSRYVDLAALVRIADPEIEYHMVTFTVRNGVDLLERYEHLAKSLRAAHKRRHRLRSSEFEKILGAVWSFEAKRGTRSGLWHPHVHCIWACARSAPPNAAALSNEWRDITGDSFIVETHPLRGVIAEAFAEVFKYAVKFADLPLDDNLHAYEVLHRRRLVGSSGVLFGVEVPDSLEDDAFEGGAYFDLFFQHYRGSGYIHTGCIEQQVAA